ncbi:MAG TPA: DUF4190 domain-containing protein [Tepidisphaeraceae bacterium]|jgi:hypothetical protein
MKKYAQLEYAVQYAPHRNKWAVRSFTLGLVSGPLWILFGMSLETNGINKPIAVALSLLSLAVFHCLPVIMGIVARQQIIRSNEVVRGRWMAFAGILSSCIWLIFIVVSWLVLK